MIRKIEFPLIGNSAIEIESSCDCSYSDNEQVHNEQVHNEQVHNEQVHNESEKKSEELGYVTVVSDLMPGFFKIKEIKMICHKCTRKMHRISKGDKHLIRWRCVNPKCSQGLAWSMQVSGVLNFALSKP
jgi:hypothetical protein